MNASWIDFLVSNGAVMAENCIQHFGNAQAELTAAAQGNVLVDLSHIGLLELIGEDTQTFLQGQITNDVKQLDGSNSQYAGYCTAKGRLLATLLLWKAGDAHYLQLDGGITPMVMKRLTMYVLRSKVKIADASDKLVRLGISGNEVEQALAAIFPNMPQQSHHLAQHNGLVLLRLPGIMPRFELVVPFDDAPALWQQLAQNCKPASAQAWDWLDIRAGIPQVTAATQEEFVPQMLNLDILNGISFNKGCYTGQEIVARTHYLGKVKRRTHLAHVAAPVQAGNMVYGVDSGEAVGLIVNATPAPQGGYDVLAEIRLESVEAGPVRLESGAALELQKLPYGL